MNLGNERKVLRIELENPVFWTSKKKPGGYDVFPSTDGLYPRGQLLWFGQTDATGTTNVFVGAPAVAMANKAKKKGHVTAAGIVAEAFTDTRAIVADTPGRRQPRVNLRRLAVPVTFNGVDIAVGDEPHNGFAPGDFVCMCMTNFAAGPFTVLRRADEDIRDAVYLGVAHTAAEPGTHHVELYVNPF
jgi:hypothetical protein